MAKANLTVKVELPEVTTRLLAAVKAAHELAEVSQNHFPSLIAVEYKQLRELGYAEGRRATGLLLQRVLKVALLPNREHIEDICATGLVLCDECAAAGDTPEETAA